MSVTLLVSQLPMSLIESGGVREHVIHVCHLARVPAANVLIESGGVIEHELMSVTLLVSQALMSSLNVVFPEGIRHVSHSPSTPLGDIAVFTALPLVIQSVIASLKLLSSDFIAGWNTGRCRYRGLV